MPAAQPVEVDPPTLESGWHGLRRTRAAHVDVQAAGAADKELSPFFGIQVEQAVWPRSKPGARRARAPPMPASSSTVSRASIGPGATSAWIDQQPPAIRATPMPLSAPSVVLVGGQPAVPRRVGWIGSRLKSRARPRRSSGTPCPGAPCRNDAGGALPVPWVAALRRMRLPAGSTLDVDASCVQRPLPMRCLAQRPFAASTGRGMRAERGESALQTARRFEAGERRGRRSVLA
jgi:hypothetical protein